MKIKISIYSALFALFLSLSQIAMAAEVKTSEFKPFAEKHVILQLSDQVNEAVVLDTANNLIKNYGGPDMIDIEIVTFGSVSGDFATKNGLDQGGLTLQLNYGATNLRLIAP